MAGKPTIPAKVHERIRLLYATGEPKRLIAKWIGCSVWTVRKAIDPQFAERERVRMRDVDARRAAERSADPRVRAYRAAYADTDEYREASRRRMAVARAKKAAQANSGKWPHVMSPPPDRKPRP